MEALGGCVGATGEEVVVDGALAALSVVTQHLDLATGSAGQVAFSQSPLVMSVVGLEKYGGFGVWRIVSALHPVPAETAARL